MQLLIKKQWWSKRYTHLLQYLQWSDKVCLFTEVSEYIRDALYKGMDSHSGLTDVAVLRFLIFFLSLHSNFLAHRVHPFKSLFGGRDTLILWI